MGLAEFWGATLREIWMVIEADNERRAWQWRLAIASGWSAARLVWTKEIPPLDDLAPLTSAEDDSGPVNDEAQVMAWTLWARQHNASLEGEPS